LVGMAIGGAAAVFLTRLLRSELYGVQPDHLLTFIIAVLLLFLPTLFACLIPAAKAASFNPSVALRAN
jgi:putative ABC transport system permease protein